MELELGLAPPTNTGRLLGGKRGFGEAFGEDEGQRASAAVATTLPLFDDGSSSSSSSDGGVGGGMNKKALVGWPPVSSARSRACGGGRHVKVRKEGAAIGRKVDLSLHGSYGDLLATLARMFPEPAGDRVGCLGGATGEGEMVVTYEDADGDWMLVGDVPWEDFARSVKRLKILL